MLSLAWKNLWKRIIKTNYILLIRWRTVLLLLSLLLLLSISILKDFLGKLLSMIKIIVSNCYLKKYQPDLQVNKPSLTFFSTFYCGCGCSAHQHCERYLVFTKMDPIN